MLVLLELADRSRSRREHRAMVHRVRAAVVARDEDPADKNETVQVMVVMVYWLCWLARCRYWNLVRVVFDAAHVVAK